MGPARVNHKGSSCATGGWNNSEHHTHEVRRARANVKTNKYSDTYGHKAFAPAITGMSGKVHVHFIRLLWFLADKQEDKIGNEAFRWTMAKDCNSDKTSIGFCCTTRCNLSVHSLADPHSGSCGYSRAVCARPGAPGGGGTRSRCRSSGEVNHSQLEEGSCFCAFSRWFCGL